MDMYRIFHPKPMNPHSTQHHMELLKIIHIQRCKINLCKSMKLEIIPSIPSYSNALKRKMSCKQISSKYTNSFRLNNSILSDEWVNA